MSVTRIHTYKRLYTYCLVCIYAHMSRLSFNADSLPFQYMQSHVSASSRQLSASRDVVHLEIYCISRYSLLCIPPKIVLIALFPDEVRPTCSKIPGKFPLVQIINHQSNLRLTINIFSRYIFQAIYHLTGVVPRLTYLSQSFKQSLVCCTFSTLRILTIQQTRSSWRQECHLSIL